MMNMVRSQLTGIDVPSDIEIWRHECECRWLLANKPTRSQKHLYLYGVTDRAQLMTYDMEGKESLRDNYRDLWPTKPKPLMHYRGLAVVDRILADAKRLYEMAEQAA